MIETPLPVSVLGVLIASVGCFWTGRQDRGRAVAAADARAREAETATQAAMLDKTRAETRLAPMQDDLRRTNAALSASGELEGHLRRNVQNLAAALAAVSERRIELSNEVEVAYATLATAYVRVGNRFLRWRADGLYPALAAGPEATPAADIPLEPAQDALEGNGPTFNGTDTSGPVQDPVAASETRARGQGPVLTTTCGCIRCHDEQAPVRASLPADMRWTSFAQPGFRYMCDLCGNKRCPHHADHRFACTGSNDAGQVGVLVDPPLDHGRYAGLDRGEPTRQGDA